ncbi:Ulp1 protease family, C-terminal catalytic domain containing protein [Melia azedarach]|uniref:Ulp1 protease family, C-terminal catalytic domain containing protein n=1 Tax=Melia azedarach TaxID=155640 RepID=A0ACC1XZY3_MELAZ|nr:Ulp1 protease family, C-terminal catalytic domain containing protein [Melia azedarach]
MIASTHLYSSLTYAFQGVQDGVLEEGTFYDSVDIEQHVMGDREGVHRTWTTVDMIYIPARVCKDHWGACALNISDRKITVYDSLPSAHSEVEIKEAMQPLCILLPHLLHHGGVYMERTYLEDNTSPFNYIQPLEGIPHQAPESGDCGIFTLKFIEYLGLGRPFDFGPEHDPLFRRKIAVDLFVNELL